MHITDLKNNDRVLLKDGIKEGKIYKNTICGSIGITITEDMTKLSNTVVTVMINDWEDYLFFMIAECLIVKTDDNHKYIIPFSFVKQIVKEKKPPKPKYTVGQKVLISIDHNKSAYTFDTNDIVVPATIKRMTSNGRIVLIVKGYNHDNILKQVREGKLEEKDLSENWIYGTDMCKIVGDVNANKK